MRTRIQALNNPDDNLEGKGVKFVASPRHADMLLVTGPVSVNMEEALKRTYDAVPIPNSLSLSETAELAAECLARATPVGGSIANVISVDYTVVGCPPNPVAILNGILQTVRSPVFDTAGTEK